MHRLITLSNLRVARAFVDYMATQGVQIELRRPGNEVELWLADDSQLEMVQRELDSFILNPFDEKYAAASWQTGSMSAGIGYRSESYWQAIRDKAGPLTLGVMAVCLLMYGVKILVGNETLISLFGFAANSGQYIDLWRWVTPAFLHFSVLHITFNLLWWWYLGGAIERNLGLFKLLEISLLSAVISNYAQFIVSDNYFGGLSGVVYALMGYCWLYGERRPDSGIKFERSIMVFALVWLILGYFDIFGMPIGNAAHLSGLIVGLILAWWNTRTFSH